MSNWFGNLAKEASNFIEKNPEQLEQFKNTAAGFLKNVVDKEEEKEAQKIESGQKLTKAEQMKAQALDMLGDQLDNMIGGGNQDEEAEAPNKPAVQNEDEEDDTDTPSKPPSQRPPGKPSYLIGKPSKKEEEDDNEIPNKEYDDDVDAQLSNLVQAMWNADENKLTPDVDYKINVQGFTKAYKDEDWARDKLFENVDESVFSRPTYARFIALLDNYIATTGATEQVTDKEQQEMDDFLDSVMETEPMKKCHAFLLKKGMIQSESVDDFKKDLADLWFGGYGRDRRNDTSSFEHVFVGEIRHEEVKGMHNWIRIYQEEQKGELDYYGYMKGPYGSAKTNSNDMVLSMQFYWKGHKKKFGSVFMGTSPEFELALYTTCFYLGSKDNFLELDTGTGDVFKLNIISYHTKGKIGGMYPEIVGHTDDDDE